MSIVVAELIASREGSPSKQTLQYKVAGVTGPHDDAQVFEAVLETAPMTHNGLARQDEDIKIEPQGNGLWFAEVSYKQVTLQWPSQDGTDEFKGPEYAFDTTGGTHHIEHSQKTERAYGSENLDFGGHIGVNNGEVAGVDVVIPNLEFTERHYLVDGRVTHDYVKLLRDTTGTVNKAAFRGFEAGEVLFLGARGDRTDPGYWSVEFMFAVSKNKRGIVIGDCEVGLKKGWQHLWIHYREEKDDTGKFIIPKPVAVYVETVYDETDFTTLGIAQPVLGTL